jgi:hypothetical protein
MGGATRDAAGQVRWLSETAPEIPHQRQYAEDDHDHAQDLLESTLDGKQVHEVEHKKNYDECDQNSDQDRQYRHERPPFGR